MVIKSSLNSIIADSSAKSTNKKKKRKLLPLDDKPETPKKHRSDGPEKRKDVEGGESSKQEEFDHSNKAGLPWRNLQLILSLHSKEIDIQKKIELAFDYVNSRAKEGEDDYETVKISRLVVFLNDWVQLLLFSTDKKIRVTSGLVEGYLDYRCWLIFKFCLEESLRLQVSLSLSKDLLRVFGFIARDALFLVTDTPLNSKYSSFTGDEFKLYSVVLDCVSLVFLSHGGLSNENLDLWMSTVSESLKLVTRIFDEKIEDGNAGTFALQFSCLVLEPFAKFLRVHPARKNGFCDFVDKLVEPLLYLLGVLNPHSGGSNTALTGNLLTVVREVLSQGLFHSVHIDGFLSLQGVEKYSPSNGGKVQGLKTVIKSYHRHFFDKLEKVVASKKEFELCGLGELFHLLVDKVRKQRTISMEERAEGSHHLSFVSNQSNVAPSENSYRSNHLTAEKRKSLFDFFVQMMEPLLHEMEGYCQSKSPAVLDAHCTVKSINNLLVSLLHEKVYVKTEDFSEGACLSFLEKVCSTILSLSDYLYSLPTHDTDGKMQEMIISLAKQLLVAVQYFLGIDYDILKNYLSSFFSEKEKKNYLPSLWNIMLSYLALGHSLKDVPNQCLLTSQAVGLSCQLVKLYSDLRQVEDIIFALCEAIRCIMVHENDSYCKKTRGSFQSFTNLFPSDAYAKSVQVLLCEQEFQLAISNSIKALPEGQASACVRKLRKDLSKSIGWMKNNNSVEDGKEYQESNTRKHTVLFLDVPAELFGGGLSVLYALVLDSLTVTVGNSSRLDKSIRRLISELRPSMSILAGLQPDSVSKFLFFVAGKTSDEDGGNKHILTNFGASIHWVFVFFFRLYIFCRSLCRQVITLMPPDKSRRISADMLDFFTAYSGKDLIERTERINEEYFSWVAHPSASLLVVIQSVSDVCVRGSIADDGPLIYTLHVMALQRMVDLNRQIKSLQYKLQGISKSIEAESLDDASLSQCSKRSRKWTRRLSALKDEAEGLVEYVTSYLPLLDIDKLSVCSTDDETCLATCVQAMDESHKWDLGVCSVNMDSLPTAIWWILCQNVDVWPLYASKKKLKMFLSYVIRTCLPFISSGCTNGESYRIDEAGSLNKINVHQISYDLLTDSILYEQDFVQRLLSSTFCGLLKKSVLPLFSDFSFGNLDLNSSPDWQEILSTVGSLQMAVSGSPKQLEGKPISLLQFKLPADITVEAAGLKVNACHCLLSLLCWIPKGYMNSKSFSLYVTHLLNLERYVISSLLECRDALSSNCQYQLLRLLVSCRRTLKGMIKGLCEEKTGTFRSLIIPVLSEDLFAVMWLFKSVNIVVGLQDVLSKDWADEVRESICSLMDHTSQLFLTLSKHYFNFAYEHCALRKSRSRLASFENSQGWKNVLLVAEILKEHTKGVLIFMKDALSNEKEGKGVNVISLDLLSSTISCLSGFLWGLTSALNYINATKKMGLFSSVFRPGSGIHFCIDVFAEFISFVLNMLFVEDSRGLSGPEELLSVATVLGMPDTYQCKLQSNCLLQSLLKGDNPQAAILIKQLLVASSALLKLNLQTNRTTSLSSLVPLFFDICHVLLFKLAHLSEVPKPFTFLLFDGILCYLQELWCHFPSDIESESSRNVYTSLIEMHLNALGMCISLQGKEAILSSYGTDSRSKVLCSEEGSISHLSFFLDEFKAKSRTSFKALFRNSFHFHMMVVDVIEIALVGANDGCTIIHNLSTGSPNGGKCSALVAAGIDCLDLLVEYVSVRRKLDVKEETQRLFLQKIQSLMSALFNIIVHLQSPLVYYSVTTGTIPKVPDPGAVILMSVELLTRISGKNAVFGMNSLHVAQTLRIPAVLFQDFCKVRESETFFSVDNHDSDIVVSQHALVDKKFSTALYSACCRLLSTTLNHHISDSKPCIALLQESVRVLLHCLETTDSEIASRKNYFQIGGEEGVRRASSLRRIYEDLGKQKEDFGHHCFRFLSDYILVYSGCGPHKTGLRREIDEELKEGIYALIDSCKADDLQHLHSVYGEGPCRNTLASLQHDYKLNYQYTGKV